MSESPVTRYWPASGDISPFQQGKSGKLQSGSTWGCNELKYLHVDFQSGCALKDIMDPRYSTSPSGKAATFLEEKLGMSWEDLCSFPAEERNGTFYGLFLLLAGVTKKFDAYEDEHSSMLETEAAIPAENVISAGTTGPVKASTPPLRTSSQPTTPPMPPVADRTRHLPLPGPIPFDQYDHPGSPASRAGSHTSSEPSDSVDVSPSAQAASRASKRRERMIFLAADIFTELEAEWNDEEITDESSERSSTDWLKALNARKDDLDGITSDLRDFVEEKVQLTAQLFMEQILGVALSAATEEVEVEVM